MPDTWQRRRTATSEHRHHIGVFDTEAFLLRSVVAFVAPALQAGTIAVVVLTEARRRAVDAALTARGVDVATARERGDYCEVDSPALTADLLANGEVDVERFHAAATSVLDRAVMRGCAIRICGDMGGLLWETGEIATLLHLEQLWNTVPDAPAFDLLCLYPSRVLGTSVDADLTALCQRHTDLEPVERFASLLGPADHDRAAIVVGSQARAWDLDRTRREDERDGLTAELLRCVQDLGRQQCQFREAVASRDLIGQAKGILMVRWRVDADTAFAMLKDASSRSNRKLVVVARAVVEHQLRRN